MTNSYSASTVAALIPLSLFLNTSWIHEALMFYTHFLFFPIPPPFPCPIPVTWPLSHSAPLHLREENTPELCSPGAPAPEASHQCPVLSHLLSPMPSSCPSTEEWIKKMWYIYTMEYYSAIKKNEMMPFAAIWMDLEITILSEVSQTEKNKYHDITYMWNLKKWYKWTYLQNRNRLTDFKNKLMVTKGERLGGGIN